MSSSSLKTNDDLKESQTGSKTQLIQQEEADQQFVGSQNSLRVKQIGEIELVDTGNTSKVEDIDVDKVNQSGKSYLDTL